MNFSSMNDDELKKYKSFITDSYIDSLNEKGTITAILFFYGIFAFVGTIVWCVDFALSGKGTLVQVINYFLIISGAVSLFYGYKKDKGALENKLIIKDEIINVNNEIAKRGLS